jgi:hypothetical protein
MNCCVAMETIVRRTSSNITPYVHCLPFPIVEMFVFFLALVVIRKSVLCFLWKLKLYNTLVMPAFLYGSENWTLTALQRRRIEAAEMKLLRPLVGYTVYDHKTNVSVRRELQTECILDKIDEYRRNWQF